MRANYVERYHEGDRERGIPAGQIESAEEAAEFADFALWTAWISHTERPDSSASFTNDWPYSPAAGNDAGGPIMTWSVIAMVLLVGGAGAAIWLYQSVDLPEPEAEGASISHPSEIELTPSQLLSTRFVLIGALLFVAQTFLGGLLAHYYIERDGFFGMRELIGVDILQWLPWSIARTWHVDLGILWIATMWLGAGLFLAPLLTGREPPKQALYVKGLIGALLVIVVGGLAGIWVGVNNVFGDQLWWLLGNEGLEYLEIGRVWQAGLLVGFLGWTALVARGFKPLLDREPRYGLAHMIVYRRSRPSTSGLDPEAVHNGELIQTLFWLRMPGDTMLIAGAVLFAWDVAAKFLFQRKATADESSSHVIADRLFGDRDVVDPVSDDDD
ncbi:cytochrome B subunit of nitric oxide reductase [Natrinema mahii]|nr:cytochrome B subunit of nitric oxide reductase [Natrinema mahii]